MRREDLDLINNCIRVRNGTTKNDQGIWKPIPNNLISYFRNIPPESEYLFYRYVIKHKEYMPLGDFKTSWKRVRKLAGISDFVFHS